MSSPKRDLELLAVTEPLSRKIALLEQELRIKTAVMMDLTRDVKAFKDRALKAEALLTKHGIKP